VQITVLGKSPAWQDADGACSGYLVQGGGQTVLLDCGPGVFAKLRRFVDYVDVDAVVISHLHADHILDLVPFASGLRYAPRQQPVPVERWPGTDHPARPRLVLPQGGTRTLRTIVGQWGPDGLIDEAFRAEEYDVSDTVEVGTLRLRFHQVPHFLTAHAVEVTSANGGGRFVFGSDHRPTDALDDFAEGSDLLMLEATLPRPEREGPRGHLTPGEAGEHATRCHARRLVLTHISDELDAEWARAEAEREFGGPVEVAREGAVYSV
jgi:ribonuclease BN (tRNA processing enzyme)